VFTGIVECFGNIVNVKLEGGNKIFTIESEISALLKIDQSILHDGVCLTVVEVKNNSHRVIAIDETLRRTNLSKWNKGTELNLERAMPSDGRFDGHIVQGHIDTTAKVKKIKEKNGSWIFEFTLLNSHKGMIAGKGSICVNGVSLTVVSETKKTFSVAIIPYTYQHTNFSRLKKGDEVNIEFDIIGKYVRNILRS